MSTDDAVPAGQAGPAGGVGTARPGPIGVAERVQLLDVLRGFALLGILVVNLRLFKAPIAGAALPNRYDGAADQAASWLIAFAFESKFYVLFSLLFGYGLSVQMARAAAQGAPLAPRYLRRLGVLLVIGLAHALLLYVGDILVAYSLLGLVLLRVRGAPARTLLLAAGMLLAGWALVVGMSALAVASAGEPPAAERAAETRVAEEEAARAEAAYRGSPPTVVAQRARDLRLVLESSIAAMAPTIVAMFLVGLCAGRAGLLARVGQHEHLLRRARGVGLAIGLPGAAIYATAVHADGDRPAVALAGFAVGVIAAPALSAVYATTIALAHRRPAGARALAPLAPVGRMALSNYLLQSLVCAFLFTGYGLALFGRVGPLAGLALSVAIFTCQIPLSAWWLRRFRFGPAEWLLRSVTYLRAQPFRVAPATAGQPFPSADRRGKRRRSSSGSSTSNGSPTGDGG